MVSIGPTRHAAYPQSEYRMVAGNGVIRYIPYGNKTADEAPANARSVSKQTSETYFADLMKAISDKQFGKGIDAGNAAAAAIASRGDQQIADLRTNYADQMALMAQMGGYERGRINRDFDNQVASVGQNLAGTGLYNTTVQGNMVQGVNRNRAESLGQLEAALMQQQLGAQQNLGNQVAAAQDSQMGYQNQLANMLSGMYQSQATTLPTLSKQQSDSWSK